MVSEAKESKKEYRSKIEIIRDILSAAGKKGSKKTHIMYGANLNHKLLIEYLNYALNAGLITGDRGKCYFLTEKGKQFLEIYEDCEQRLNHLRNGREMLEKMLLS